MNVALDILSRIHTIPTVPIVDCFQKIRQQVKCYLQLAGVMGKNECMQVRGCVSCSKPPFIILSQPVGKWFTDNYTAERQNVISHLILQHQYVMDSMDHGCNIHVSW